MPKYRALLAILMAAGSAWAHRPEARADGAAAQLLNLPLPPAISELIGFPSVPEGRANYLHLIAREAEKNGLPPALADAVARVESGYRPSAYGRVGEVGLMQIRPQTAVILGYRGGIAGLFEPQTNIKLGVQYLARAWQLAEGDLCRALMKYRAGHGEERMSALSVEYCRRARQHLAAIGSPLANGDRPPRLPLLFADASISHPAPKGRSIARPGDQVGGSSRLVRELKIARAKARAGTRTAADSARFWQAHEARIRELTGKRAG
jgi:Transglycosylase SLT domain